jgi:glutamine amidotransferase
MLQGVLGVVDYEAGNGKSVMNALTWLGIDARLCAQPDDLRNCDGIVLPGVGSAAATMASLNALGLDTALTELVVEQRVPFLGICVGLQVLFETSEESDATCFGWLPGHITKLDDAQERVPHIGWNTVTKVGEHPLLRSIPDRSFFYFVHSYRAVPDDPSHILGTTDYPDAFPSIVGAGNILGVQFHTEKSSRFGLELLRNFATVAGAVPC